MTFKHIKFQDSFTMRSLEKVAREKGMIKEEPINKTASSKEYDLAPSSNFMENIIKLCSGLRDLGFNKQASELELNYLNYKKAATLYETSKETGDDVINNAHPNGSHKVEDVQGDDLAIVETILDRHMKMLDVVNKKPTGKLASSKNILNAVKLSLGEGPEGTYDQIVARGNNLLSAIKIDLTKLKNIKPMSLGTEKFTYYHIDKMMDSIKDIKDASVGDLTILLNTFNQSIAPNYDPSIAFGYIWDDTKKSQWKALEPFISNIKNNFLTCIWLRKDLTNKENTTKGQAATKEMQEKLNIGTSPQVVPPQAVPPSLSVEEPSKSVLGSYDDLLKTAALYKARVDSRELKNADVLHEWLDKTIVYLNKYKSALAVSQYRNDKEILENNSKKVEAIKQKLEAFKQKWLP